MANIAGEPGNSGDGVATPSLTFIGNATVLLRYGDLTLLTDPNFLHRGQRAYLGYGLVSRRLEDPAIELDDLPDLDGVILSHLHGDHWDRKARRGLPRDLPIVTTPHAARRLQGLHRFRRAVGMSTWEADTLVKGASSVRITALPGRHAPGVAAALLPPVMGSLIEFLGTGQRVEYRLYVTGDTLLFDGITAIAQRYPDIDAAIVHLGGTRLPGGLIVTMDGEQGADLLDIVRPHRAVPIHLDDYSVFTSGLDDFMRAIARRGMTDRVVVVERGQTISLPLGGSSHG